MQLSVAMFFWFSYLVLKVDGRLRTYRFTLHNDTRSPGRFHCPHLIPSELNEPQLTSEKIASRAKYI